MILLKLLLYVTITSFIAVTNIRHSHFIHCCHFLTLRLLRLLHHPVSDLVFPFLIRLITHSYVSRAMAGHIATKICQFFDCCLRIFKKLTFCSFELIAVPHLEPIGHGGYHMTLAILWLLLGIKFKNPHSVFLSLSLFRAWNLWAVCRGTGLAVLQLPRKLSKTHIL